MKRLFFAVLLLCCTSLVQAHKPSDAYLWLDVNVHDIQGRWDVALRDLDVVLALDANHDDKLTWGEVRTRQADINDYLLTHLSLSNSSTACTLKPVNQAIDQHSDGTYLVLLFSSACTVGSSLKIDYRLFEDIDPTHRGVTRISFAGHAPQPLVLDPAHGAIIISTDGIQATQAQPASTNINDQAENKLSIAHAGFLREGIHHILTGYDHILFLLCLLLPAVLKRTGTAREGYWEPVSFSEAIWPLLRVITAFTIAHSITLGLASARIVHLSPRLIEPAIAITIMLAALNNLWPIVTRRVAIITFFFGLIHGFGFAEVLRDLDLSIGDFAWTLLQFNLGVEIGQLLIVTAAIAPLYWLRSKQSYQTTVLAGGSTLGIALAAIWFTERVFDFKVLPL